MVFKLTPNTGAGWTQSVLYSFTGGKDGAYPSGVVVFDQAGNLYGTAGGGDLSQCQGSGCGVVFKLTHSVGGSWTESVLHRFTGGKDGANPIWVILDQTGNLYGTAPQGGANKSGVAFRLTPNADGSWTYKVIHQFGGRKDGLFPNSLIFDQAGNLYGTAMGGGANWDGNVFKLTPSADGSWTEKVLHWFNRVDGAYPNGGLVFDQGGNLYDTTSNGGNNNFCEGGCGVVFKLTPNADGGWKETVLHDFKSGTGGKWPQAGVIFDKAGNLYGTTLSGSQRKIDPTFGSVFEITP